MLAVVALSIIFMWMLCASVLVGIGALFLRRLDVESTLFDAFWTGICVTVASLQVYHFFRPIDAIIAGLVCAVGLFGIILNREMLVVALRKDARIGFWPAVYGIPVFLAIAIRCSGPAVHYDTGFYGATAVRWSVTYPIVPGLTNLLGQLGLNSSVFLCVAVLNQGPWREAGFHLFVGLLLCAFVLTVAGSFYRVLFSRNETALDYFVLLFSVPCMVWALNWEIVGTNTDLPTTIVSIAGMIALFQVFQEQKRGGKESRIGSLILVSIMLFTLAVTFKISSLALSVLGWCTSFVQLLSVNLNVRRKRHLVVAAIVFSCALAIPWLCSGVILSGYMLFPSSAFTIPVDWRVPRASADLLSRLNRSWARIPHAALVETRGLRWFEPWLAGVFRNRVDFIVPVFLSIAGFVSLLSRKERKDLFWLKLLLPSLGGLVFWFALAPALRFGEAAIWTTAACLGSAAFQQVIPTMSQRWRWLLLFGLLLVGGWCSYPRTLWRVEFRPLLDVHGFLPLPQARTMPLRLRSGLTVQVPIDTNQCWYAAIPCSPYFTDNLRLRQGKDLRLGFRADGPDLSLIFDKFTPVHRHYVRPGPMEEVCLNCHLPSK